MRDRPDSRGGNEIPLIFLLCKYYKPYVPRLLTVIQAPTGMAIRRNALSCATKLDCSMYISTCLSGMVDDPLESKISLFESKTMKE